VYSLLYYITDHGRDIRLAQFLFAGIYVASLAVVLSIDRRSRSVRSGSFEAVFERVRLKRKRLTGATLGARLPLSFEKASLTIRLAPLQRWRGHASSLPVSLGAYQQALAVGLHLLQVRHIL
jgi:hypothetical protein